MSNAIIACIFRMKESLARIPTDAAERIAADAASRAEAVAEYVAMCDNKQWEAACEQMFAK